MAAHRATMMSPPIENLLSQVDSKFTLVTLASKRARQINSYFNHLGEGLGTLVPPQVNSLSRKPLSIALEEIAAAKVGYVRIAQTADELPGAETGGVLKETAAKATGPKEVPGEEPS